MKRLILDIDENFGDAVSITAVATKQVLNKSVTNITTYCVTLSEKETWVTIDCNGLVRKGE